jgi:hypothetical protein
MVQTDAGIKERNADDRQVSRRKALARLGLGAAVVYSAPTVLRLDRSANAVQPSCTGKGQGKGNPWCKASQPPESNRP